MELSNIEKRLWHVPGLRIVVWLWLGLLLGGCQASYVDVRFAPSLTADWECHTLPTREQSDGVFFSGLVMVNNAAERRIEVDAFGWSELWGRTYLGSFELEPASSSQERQRFGLFVPKSMLGRLNLLGPWQIELQAKDPAEPEKYIGGNSYAFEPFSGYQVGQMMMIMAQPLGSLAKSKAAIDSRRGSAGG
jgi:hypothetical protein